jgi:hypothetical protein
MPGGHEDTIRNNAAKRLEQLGLWVCKTTRMTPGREGIPDLLGCDPQCGGRMLALEFKKPVKPAPLKPSQRRELAALDKAGAVTAVVHSVDEALAVLREMRARFKDGR